VTERADPHNERLVIAIAARGLTSGALAEKAGVDAHTVDRWIRTGRVPRVQAAFAAAEALGTDPSYLWPSLHRARLVHAVPPEVVAVHDERSQVSPAQWKSFFESGNHHIDVLVYAAVFLHGQMPGFNDLLVSKAQRGCRIRIALGDAQSSSVRMRGSEEKFGGGIEARCEEAFSRYRPFVGTSNIEVRTHGTTLYNSIYRADDEMLVNTHIFGINADSASLWHYRKAATGTLIAGYQESFEAVWATAKAVTNSR
jgi:lambda repressor-like predicted transcriptional regulator